VNTLGMVRTTHAFKALLKRARGRIVNTASVCGRVALPCTGPYSVSKHAVEAYSDILRAELGMWGIGVSIIEPGFFSTALTSAANNVAMLERQWGRLSDAVRAEYGEHMFEFSKAQTKERLEGICSKDTFLVVDAYFAALTSALPRRRYQVGWDSILFFIPFSMVPAILQDFFFWAVGRLSGMPTPSALR